LARFPALESTARRRTRDPRLTRDRRRRGYWKHSAAKYPARIEGRPRFPTIARRARTSAQLRALPRHRKSNRRFRPADLLLIESGAANEDRHTTRTSLPRTIAIRRTRRRENAANPPYHPGLLRRPISRSAMRPAPIFRTAPPARPASTPCAAISLWPKAGNRFRHGTVPRRFGSYLSVH